MSSQKKKTSIPIIGFIIHRLKLLGKSKLFSNESMDQLLEKRKQKDEEERTFKFDLNMRPRINLSKPLNIIGHVLLWYNIPVLIGIALSLVCGYYYETYIRFIDYLEVNVFARTLLFMAGLSPLVAIIGAVALIRTLEEEYDIAGDGTHLLNASDLPAVAESLDWSEAGPEVEGADWLRDLLQQLWSNINIYAIRLVSEYLPNCSLDPLLGPINRISRFEIKKLFLGDRVPQITGIHVLSRGVRREDLIIDCELTFDSDLEIEITGNYFITFGVKWFYFKSKTRLLLSPLFRELPVVGTVQISFLETPRLNWRFTGLLAILNWDFMKGCVQCILSFFFRNPHYFSVNLAKISPKRELKLREPIGLLRCEVMSAKNVHRKESETSMFIKSPDPYCKVEVEEQSMSTSIIRSDSNPEWNQEFCFLVHNSIVNSIIFSVFDEDMIEDQLIGRFSIAIKDFVDYQDLNGREVTVALTRIGQKPKPVTKTTPRLSFRVSWFKLTQDISLLNANLRLSRTQLPVAALSVLIDSATGLDTCTAQVRSPELRPLVKISVGNQCRYTTCKRRTGCPVWEEAHHFILYNPIWETIHLEVMDQYWVEERQLLPFVPISVSSFGSIADSIGLSDKGTLLGSYDIPTNDVLKAYRMKIEGSYRLNGFVENGFLRLLTTIRIAEYEPLVTENVRKPRVLLNELMAQIKNAIELEKLSKAVEEAMASQEPKQEPSVVSNESVASNASIDSKDERKSVVLPVKVDKTIENETKDTEEDRKAEKEDRETFFEPLIIK